MRATKKEYVWTTPRKRGRRGDVARAPVGGAAVLAAACSRILRMKEAGHEANGTAAQDEPGTVELPADENGQGGDGEQGGQGIDDGGATELDHYGGHQAEGSGVDAIKEECGEGPGAQAGHEGARDGDKDE